MMDAKSLEAHIEVTPGVVSGQPRIAGHRITVQTIAIWHEHLGRSVDEMASEYDLTLGDVYAALAFYHDHREEIDRSIRESDAFVEELRQGSASRLREKLSLKATNGGDPVLYG